MAGANDISKNAFGELKDFSREKTTTPGKKLDEYSRELNVKNLAALEAAEIKAAALTTDKLEAAADRAFNFVLKEFGLEKVNARVFKTDTEPADSADDANEFLFTDKGSANMHTGEGRRAPMSPLGTPVFADVILKHSKKVDYTLGVEERTESIHLLWCLCEVHQTKNIVKTKVQGRDGEVKEYISDGDFMVTLRGAFSSTFMQAYPKDIIKRLINICLIKEPLAVTSEFLQLFGIRELVIEEYKFNQVEGKQNVQKFELMCSSDVPLILKKKNNVRNR
ncbi:MAG TPA: DUF6046 domain-containing protein [Ferruginibacter sp.]|nr:DUF6046 domain-containing protein [Ferruginibacter sp.]HMP22170.1 DUF6046 domain-containing protein [Ferruginibacter sp.]